MNRRSFLQALAAALLGANDILVAARPAQLPPPGRVDFMDMSKWGRVLIDEKDFRIPFTISKIASPEFLRATNGLFVEKG